MTLILARSVGRSHEPYNDVPPPSRRPDRCRHLRSRQCPPVISHLNPLRQVVSSGRLDTPIACLLAIAVATISPALPLATDALRAYRRLLRCADASDIGGLATGAVN